MATGESDSEHLPLELLATARRIREQIFRHNDLDRAAESWGLSIASTSDDLHELNWRELEELGLQTSWESAFAPLAAGLILAIQGGTPDRHVWASAADNRTGGLDGVGALQAKLAAAKRFGVQQLFLSVSDKPNLECVVSADLGSESGLTIRFLEDRKARSVEDLLVDYLVALNWEPPLTQGITPEYAEWYRRHCNWSADERSNEIVYRNKLLELVACRCRTLALPHADNIEVLVAVADNPSLVALLLLYLQPQRCILLHTRDRLARARETEDLVRNKGYQGVIEILPITTQDWSELQTKLATLKSERLVFDLTGGTKLMSLALAIDVATPGSRLHYLDHQIDGKQRILGSETPRFWTKVAS